MSSRLISISGAEDNNPAKHKEMFDRRAAKGQCFHRPYLGCRKFPAHFEPVGGSPAFGPSTGDRFGWMLHDIDFENEMEARFFRAVMVDGIIEVPPLNRKEVKT